MRIARLIIHKANKFIRIIKSIKMIKTYEDGKKFMKIIKSIIHKVSKVDNL